MTSSPGTNSCWQAARAAHKSKRGRARFSGSTPFRFALKLGPRSHEDHRVTYMHCTQMASVPPFQLGETFTLTV